MCNLRVSLYGSFRVILWAWSRSSSRVRSSWGSVVCLILIDSYLSGGFIDKHLKLEEKKNEENSISVKNLPGRDMNSDLSCNKYYNREGEEMK